jgi:hypothetical protein
MAFVNVWVGVSYVGSRRVNPSFVLGPLACLPFSPADLQNRRPAHNKWWSASGMWLVVQGMLGSGVRLKDRWGEALSPPKRTASASSVDPHGQLAGLVPAALCLPPLSLIEGD